MDSSLAVVEVHINFNPRWYVRAEAVLRVLVMLTPRRWPQMEMQMNVSCEPTEGFALIQAHL